MGKCLKKIIYNRLYKFRSSQGILSDSQYGFRKGHSTAHAINYSTEIIKNEINKKNHVLGIFIDLSKAFDTLDHNILLHKINKLGIRGIANDLIRSYMTNRKQYTSFLGENSETEPILFGVPQGSVLGPLLFLLYINDIVDYVTDETVKVVLYADDTNLFIIGKDRQMLIKKANKTLEKINNYMKSNLLHINVEKCCFMHFSPKTKQLNKEMDLEYDNNISAVDDDENENHTLKINGTLIPEVKSTKFLGVTIDNELSWIPHIESLHKKLKSATGMLKRMRDNIPFEHYKAIYYALFESHLSYCITVFGHVVKTHSERLFTTQKHCMRILFGNLDAYLDKFNTSARTRPIEKQVLGAEFFCKEHTKPLFNQQGILAFKNLYNYHICIDTLKTLKSRSPNCLFELYLLSSRNNKSYILEKNSLKGTYLAERTKIWNDCMKSIAKSDTITEIKFQSLKKI